MAGFEDVVNARCLEDAATTVVEVLGSGAAVWRTIGAGDRELVVGEPVAGQPTASATGVCRATIEVTADADAVLLDAVAALLAEIGDRIEIADRARRSRRQLADSERIGALGTYAWTLATDELDWSDGLLRIYGHEPGSIQPSYERFLRQVHPDDRADVRRVHERSLATGEPFEMEERIVRPDGEVRVLWSLGEVSTDDAGQPTGIVGVCRDVTEQREAERRVADAEQRRRQALELNDNVIQGLVTLLWQLDSGTSSEVRRIAEATLAAARRMVTDLLRDADDGDPDELVRSTTVDLEPAPDTGRRRFDQLDDRQPAGDGQTADGRAARDGAVPGGDERSSSAPLTVVIADDLPTLRMLLRMRLNREDGIEVLAEACDGAEAVELTTDLQPDVVVLDLSMPVLDGLAATRRIREVSPGTRVIILSGYPAETMAADALAAGAERYVEKSSDLDELCAAVLAGHRVGDLGITR